MPASKKSQPWKSRVIGGRTFRSALEFPIYCKVVSNGDLILLACLPATWVSAGVRPAQTPDCWRTPPHCDILAPMDESTSGGGSTGEPTRCPDEGVLSAFVEQRLSPTQTARCEQHLDRCESCRRLIGDWGRQFGANDRDADDALAPGATVGRFLIVAQLGSGASADVFAAQDTLLDRQVALKVLRTTVDEDGAADPALLREARALAQLSHPNVVEVFDVGVTRRRPFLALSRVDGPTLRVHLAEHTPTQREIVALFVEAGRGLVAAHRAGLVHRDFKPDNVIIDRDGRPRVTDFGLAIQTRGVDGPAQLAGTPLYMAPEQHTGQTVDARSDVYAFGAALCEALCGAPPFSGQTPHELQRQKQAEALQTAAEFQRLPKRLRAALRRSLRADPAERFQALEPFLNELAATGEKPKLALLLGAAAAVSALGLLALLSAAAWFSGKAPVVAEAANTGPEALASAGNAAGAPARPNLVQAPGAVPTVALSYQDGASFTVRAHSEGELQLPQFVFSSIAPNAPDMTLVEAMQQCRSFGSVLCNEALWERACHTQPKVGKRRAWTASMTDGKLPLRGGAGCSARSLAAAEQRQSVGRIACCSSFSAIVRGGDEMARSRAGNFLNGIQLTINTPNVPLTPMLFDERVTVFDQKDLTPGAAVRHLDQLRSTPGAWSVHDECSISTRDDELHAGCGRLSFDGKELAHYQTSYTWKNGPTYGLRRIENAKKLWPLP